MKRRFLIGYSFLFIAGCTATKNTSNNSSSQVSNLPKYLKLAVTDVSGINELQRDFGEFSTVLEDILKIRIELFPVENPTAAAPALLSGNLDIAFSGPSEYLILHSRAKAIPIIGVKRKDYHTIFVVRANSNIQTLAQLKGKTIAMRKIGSTSGHIAPTGLLIDAGLNPKTDYKTVMLDNKGGKALKAGEVDAWTISSDRYKNVLESEGLSEKDFKIIFKGPELPSDVFVASNQLANNVIETLRSQMLKNQERLIQSMVKAQANRKYVDSQMVIANDADYKTIREVYQKIGQDSFIK
ncbi:phosphate/phosphite/phosphonate ABC transporter substrate-binding protein [Nostoc sp. CMAA1605]|uniref:phosphate/phosphite/phosphonate ABC transporter substrate-binding protein n=1 Tax=Nostoc sp. CMAA1605 TaxID=2055159 RepID=UPI001F4614FE|nr:phosphate/phosphite/phosphonate ABC transporter substrate-binding protein [Nostoc sp. CMAA1605]MCF4968557.1 phosphonate ABC transporter substrate-binding protein [Nostoc sp. CMAA1605]